MITTASAEFRAALPSGGRLIGLDVGTKTIGTALCDAGWSFASPAELVRRTKFSKDKAQLQALIAAQQVKGLVIGLPLVVGASQAETRATAEARVAGAPGDQTARARLLADLGYPVEEVEAMSDRLVDAMVAHGDADSIAAAVRAHLTAGADHVTFLIDGSDYDVAMSQLEAIAPAFADLA